MAAYLRPLSPVGEGDVADVAPVLLLADHAKVEHLGEDLPPDLLLLMLEGLLREENVLVLVDGRQNGEPLALVLRQRLRHLRGRKRGVEWVEIEIETLVKIFDSKSKQAQLTLLLFPPPPLPLPPPLVLLKLAVAVAPCWLLAPPEARRLPPPPLCDLWPPFILGGDEMIR